MQLCIIYLVFRTKIHDGNKSLTVITHPLRLYKMLLKWAGSDIAGHSVFLSDFLFSFSLKS